MIRNLDTSLLRSFVAVVETGGMTRAAAQLNLTQAAVSQQMRRLEETLGQALLMRQRQRVLPSAAGERLLARAQRLLALNDDIWATMTAAEVEGEVRFGVPHDLVAAFIPSILKAFDRDRQRVRVNLVSSTTRTLLAGLDRGALDICLGTEHEVARGGEVLFADRLVWVGAIGGSAWSRDPLPVSIGESDGNCAFRAPTLVALAAAGRDWRLAFETSDVQGVTAGVAADLALAVMLSSTVPRDLEPVAPVAGLPSLPTFNVTLHLARGQVSPATVELAALIRRRLVPARLAG